MINVEGLKKLVIELAIRGKVSTQNYDSEQAESIIELEKLKVSTKKSKKSNKNLPPVSLEEIPFDIPKNWIWCRWGELIDVISGVSYQKEDICSSGLRILRGGNIQNNKVLLFSDDVFLPESYRDDIKNVKKGDTIIVASTGSQELIGKPGYISNSFEEENVMIGAFLRICRPRNPLLSDYFNLLFQSVLYKNHIRNSSQGTNINNIKESYITLMPIPLPPLEEQRRIVDKVNKIFNEIKIISENKKNLASIKEKLMNKVTQSALSGRLVEQIQSEGDVNDYFNSIETNERKNTKKGSGLLNIQDDEIPYEIPKSWRWCKVGEICHIVNGFTPSRTNPEFWENGSINWMTVDDINKQGKYIFETAQHITEKAVKSSDRIIPPDSTFLCCTSATIGRVAINKVPMASNQQFNGIVINDKFKTILSNEFLYLVCSTYKNQLIDIAGITTFPFVSVSKLANMFIPVPPINEQKRILKKIQEITSVCDVF